MNGPWRITLDTNPDDCNLHCVMCEEHSPHSPQNQLRMAGQLPRRRMDWSTVESALREAARNGLREVIPSTMGEPLLWPHFEDLLGLCRDLGLRVNLTTNGTFPKLGAQVWSERILPVASDIKISWNGATAATQQQIMSGTRWETQVANLRTLVRARDTMATPEHRPTITLQATFMDATLSELPAMVQLACDEGVDRVKGHHLWVHWATMTGQDLRRTRERTEAWNRVAAECRAVAAQRDPPLRLDNFHDLQATDRMVPQEWDCPFLGREAWVNWQGRFDPCCAPDQQRLQLGSFGNVNQGLMAIWDSPAYKALKTDYKNRSLCKTCTMRRPA